MFFVNSCEARLFARYTNKKQQGISKNPSHGESTESFPSFVTKILRIGSTIRADFCLD